MTALITHRPLQELSMSAIQSGSRRLSARLHEKDISQTQNRTGTVLTSTAKGKKRKNDYEEEDDGFAFSRVKKNKKSRQSSEHVDKIAVQVPQAPPAQREARKKLSSENKAANGQDTAATITKKDRRKKMSFSTPTRAEQPVRRSKRLSSENAQRDASPITQKITAKAQKTPKEKISRENGTRVDAKSTVKEVQDVQLEQPIKPVSEEQQAGKTVEIPPRDDVPSKEVESNVNSEEQHSSTKISLPFADTPVIRRNKAMREGRGSKGDRRSSLGMRGRRASSLIETGNSNALPHKEVEITEFYKHIESDMMEPRRMKQLLTWCATRAMHPKSKGTDTNESGPISAARIIEGELLKELVNKSELSDWFSREDVTAPTEPLPERPHPKNVQNAEKIAQLEQQIQRLRVEKDALEALLKSPEIPAIESGSPDSGAEEIDTSLLSDEDAAILKLLNSSVDLSTLIPQRISTITSALEPAIDTFADGVHKIAQYRNAADDLASRVLAICADKISEREREGRKKALHSIDDRSPGRDLSNVLRGLSKADR